MRDGVDRIVRCVRMEIDLDHVSTVLQVLCQFPLRETFFHLQPIRC
jgi:hypothetical protein